MLEGIAQLESFPTMIDLRKIDLRKIDLGCNIEAILPPASST